jgi:hypothetical protein
MRLFFFSSKMVEISDETVFWIFTGSFIAISVLNAATCASYFYYSRKFAHMKAKDPVNLLFIFVSGQFQSWGHFLYSIPIYNTSNYLTMCLLIGYVCQHLLGTTLLFDCLVSRLVKYGAIFNSFSMCSRRNNGENPLWIRDEYIARTRRLYKISLVVVNLFMILPVFVFTISVYQTGAIGINEYTNLCQTVKSWKLVFIIINMSYFIALAFLLCFIPRYIKNKYFNESISLRDSIIYSTVVFCIEIWFGLRDQFTDLSWVMFSNFLVFSISGFIIARLFWYRLYKAVTNDTEFETLFKSNYRRRTVNVDRYKEIVLEAKFENAMTIQFINFCNRHHENDQIHLASSRDPTITTTPTVSTVVDFIEKCLTLEHSIEALLSNHSDFNNLQDMQAALHCAQQEIITAFFSVPKIPITEEQLSDMRRVIKGDINCKCLIVIMLGTLKELYNQFFKEFEFSDEMCQINTKRREMSEEMSGAEELLGLDGTFDQFTEVELSEGTL